MSQAPLNHNVNKNLKKKWGEGFGGFNTPSLSCQRSHRSAHRTPAQNKSH